MPYTVIDTGQEPDYDDFEKAVGKALMRAANVLRRHLATPPTKKPGMKHLAGPLPGGFYTERQRKFVIGGIKSGLLRVPYIRTGNLPRSWSISKVHKTKSTLFVSVYSDPSEAPYNEWVQQDDPGAKRQQVPMHDDWLTPDEAATKYEKAAVNVIVDELKKWGFK
jgi:hypothetical protein